MSLHLLMQTRGEYMCYYYDHFSYYSSVLIFLLSTINQGIYNGCCLRAHISLQGIITPGLGQTVI